MLSGCLVEDPPPYVPPTQTPPRLDSRLAKPPIDQIIVRGQADPIDFSIPFASEDAGDRVLGFLFFDGKQEDNDTRAGSTLDADNRHMDLTYSARSEVAFGCHRVLMRLSHELNFSRTTSGEPIDPSDVAEAHWLVNIIDLAAGDDGSVLRGCP